MVKLFTHTDLDGIGCAILAKLSFGDDVDISYCNYDEINEKVEEFFDINTMEGCECHITDISIKDDLAEKINNSKIRQQYKLFDHHATALDLDKYDWCTVKVEDDEIGIKTSGTELYYKWLFDNNLIETNMAIKNFVAIVRNYDTWRWSTIGKQGIVCKQVNDLLYLYGRDKFIEWCLDKLNNGFFPDLGETELTILDIRQKEIDAYVEEKSWQIYKTNIKGRICGIIFAEKYSSELGNRLCKMYPELDFVAMINMGNQSISYRSIKQDFNLGEFVRSTFGGGGHPQAAGSNISRTDMPDILNCIFDKIIVEEKNNEYSN